MARLSSMGDVSLTTGVLRWLNQRHGWTFSVLTKPAWTPIFEGHPAVRSVLELPPGKLSTDMLSTGAFLRYARGLAAGAEGSVPLGSGLLDLHGSLRTRLLSLLWKGPVRRTRRLGLERRIFLASRGRFFEDALLRYTVTQRYALAVEAVAPPRNELLPVIYLTDAERAVAQERLERAGIAVAIKNSTVAADNFSTRRGQPPLVALHPYAAHSLKTWPEDRWRELTARLDAKHIRWFVLGQGKAFLGGPADFTGQTSLRESCALLARADVLVTGDSGPMHLAGGVGTPVAALFGPTGPHWGFYPQGPRDIVLERPLACRPCSLHGKAGCKNGHACMLSITTNDLFAAIRRILDTDGAPV